MPRYSILPAVLLSLLFQHAQAEGDACLTRPLEPGHPPPHYPCRVDGCSAVPDFDIGDCCNEHDRIYWEGGTREQRLSADRQFRQCISDLNHGLLAPLYYYGVRIGGVPWLPTPWRWGFGWRYESGYRGYRKTGFGPADVN